MVSLKQLQPSYKIVDSLPLTQKIFQTISSRVWKRIHWKEDYSLSVVLEALKDEEGQVRCHAAWVLSKIGCKSKAAVPALVEALKDEEMEVRRIAAKTLWSTLR